MVGFSTMSHIKEIGVQIDINIPYTCSELRFSIVTPRYVQHAATRHEDPNTAKTPLIMKEMLEASSLPHCNHNHQSCHVSYGGTTVT